jgi:DMSO/TMAO reductase YedYZ molybdopterin-dependent catalytic subunit
MGSHEMSAVLDCTSGWALETGWHGVQVADLLAAAGATSDAREVEVRSATGWSTVLPIEEARTSVLAWDVAGQPLPHANGAPIRLVVPDRRGLDWVKWVTLVRVG